MLYFGTVASVSTLYFMYSKLLIKVCNLFTCQSSFGALLTCEFQCSWKSCFQLLSNVCTVYVFCEKGIPDVQQFVQCIPWCPCVQTPDLWPFSTVLLLTTLYTRLQKIIWEVRNHSCLVIVVSMSSSTKSIVVEIFRVTFLVSRCTWFWLPGWMPHAWVPHWDWPNYTLSGCGIELCGIQLIYPDSYLIALEINAVVWYKTCSQHQP